MKRIISIRPKSEDPTRREQFIRGSEGTVQRKIVNMINRDPEGDYDFLIDEDGSKSVKNIKDLLGEVLNIVDSNYIAEFTEDEDGNSTILVSLPIEEGAMPQEHSVEQWKRVRKASKGTDIGDKIEDINNTTANIQYIRNPIDTGIETQQDVDRSNKKFEPNWNLKRMKLYKDFCLPIPTSHVKKSKKKK